MPELHYSRSGWIEIRLTWLVDKKTKSMASLIEFACMVDQDGLRSWKDNETGLGRLALECDGSFVFFLSDPEGSLLFNSDDAGELP